VFDYVMPILGLADRSLVFPIDGMGCPLSSREAELVRWGFVFDWFDGALVIGIGLRVVFGRPTVLFDEGVEDCLRCPISESLCHRARDSAGG
jgi:hypothetical protein